MANRYEVLAEEMVTPLAEGLGLSIYDVEYVKEGKEHYLRVYIDKPGGVDINDCEALSRLFSDKLDETDPIPEAYIMEVSSPGLGRTLKKDRHFEKSLGEETEIKLYEAVDGEKIFTGVLKAFDKDTITLETENGERYFERKAVALARLTIDF
ncbi:MAG: ribosome maturation factor RimP [Lachnospiraceae bacterium]|nr:ribosome maturation factor RimP [Lachnospiraceae bacterium]